MHGDQNGKILHPSVAMFRHMEFILQNKWQNLMKRLNIGCTLLQNPMGGKKKFTQLRGLKICQLNCVQV